MRDQDLIFIKVITHRNVVAKYAEHGKFLQWQFVHICFIILTIPLLRSFKNNKSRVKISISISNYK